MDRAYQGRDIEAMFFAPNYYRWILQEFSPFLKGNVMEVGAGSGTFSSLLLECPLTEIIAIEPSKDMYPLLAKRFRDTSSVTCRQAIFPDIQTQYQEYFDAVVYINVLEHIQDDAAELRSVYASLKEGGTVCIFVPALSWLLSDYDRLIGHFRRYHKRQLKRILEEAGFEIVSLRYFDIAGIIPWLLFIKVMKRQLTGKNVAFYDSMVMPVMRTIESCIPLPFGKNLIAVARKRRYYTPTL